MGSYELNKQEKIVKYLRSGITVYDIGAHVGFYTLIFSRIVGSQGKVYAFEPLSPNCDILNRHLVLNKITNVTIEQCVVSNINGHVLFYTHDSRALGTIIRNCNYSYKATINVPSITIDNFVYQEHNKPPNLIKMDIEGAEYLACNGMIRTLRENEPILFIALHDADSARKCLTILGKLNYRIVNLDGEYVNLPSDHPREIIALPASKL